MTDGHWLEEPLSILFLSCDLVGSTGYKQSLSKDAQWPVVFLAFYREFPQALAEASKEADIDPTIFRLWKVGGEELLYTASFSSEADVTGLVDVWLQAMDRFERGAIDGLTPQQMRMSTRGGAFIGTFPGPASHVFIPLDPSQGRSDRAALDLNDEAKDSYDPSSHLYDYLGPSIETGFRGIAAGDHRYFTMTNEVAWAVSRHRGSQGKANTDLVLLGSQILRRVEWAGISRAGDRSRARGSRERGDHRSGTTAVYP